MSDKLARRSLWRRRALVAAAVVPVSMLGLWVAIHRVEWLGPLLADSARAIVGTDAVAKLEDTAYAVEDRWNRFWRKDETPQAYWEVPSTTTVAVVTPAPVADTADPLPPFRLDDVPPVHKSWSAPGDGVWAPIIDVRRPNDPVRLYKTLLHPDRNRSWAAVAVVAVDLRRVDVHLVAGRREPESLEKEAESYERKAVIPEEQHEVLLAAFNGGFKTEHGKHGMRIDGVTLVKPRDEMCTVARYEDQSIAIATWTTIASTEGRMLWWRQTPKCMVELGKLHPGLTVENNTHWGATLDRETVIRRSAIGISQDGQVLYVGIGDSTTAPAIAKAMMHVGAYNVAQLDVNFSFPKFMTFEPREPGSKELVAKPLTKGFEYTEDDYVRKRAGRDFFYLTRKVPK